MAEAAEVVANHLEDLKLGDSKRSSQDGKKDSRSGSGAGGAPEQEQHSTASNGGQGALGTIHPDPALISALMDCNKERALVVRMEQDVLAFISDASRDILEFPVDYSNYQRMLAHKVAQYHGLQTSTSDYEGNQCRVVAHRTGPGDKNKALLASLDVSQGSMLAAVAAKSQPTWPEGPRILKRPGSSRHHERPGGGFDVASNSIGRTPKDREEEYDRARARILADGNSSTAGSASVPPAVGGRGGPGRGIIAGRGRRGGRGDRGGETHGDMDYMHGMPRYGMMGMYDSAGQPMSPVFVAPHGTPVMYMAQQPEMAWGGMYMHGRQPPPPPPGSAGSAYGSKAGSVSGTTPAGSVWTAGNTPASSVTSGTAASSTAHNSTSALAPPPPPPPPHPTGARPYQQPTAAAAMTPMAMYPAAPGGMQPIPGGPVYTYMAYPGAYAGAMPAGMAYSGMVHTAAYPNAMPGYPGAMHAGYPAGAMQAITPQGYGAVFAAAPANTATAAGGPGSGGAVAGASPTAMTPHHAMAARPAGAPAAMQMAAYPVHALPAGFQHGYQAGYQAVPYPVAMQQAGLAGMPPGATPVHYGQTAMVAHAGHPGAYPNSSAGGGRGGRGGYSHRGGHQHGSASAVQQQPPPPPANGALPATRTASTGAPGSAVNGKRDN